MRQLAELSARVLHMTEEQKQRNAAKIEELNKRVAALPPALRGLYAQKLRSLAPEAPAPQAAPVQQPPAADAAYEPEYADGYEYEEEDEDEVPARRRKKRKKHGCLIVMLVFLMLAALAAAAGWFWLSGEVSGSRGAAVTQSVTIEKGSGPLAIGQKLQDAGIIRSAQVFRFYVRGKDGAADTLQYGTFELSSDMSYDEIIAALQVATDDRETVRVTFPEGKNGDPIRTNYGAGGFVFRTGISGRGQQWRFFPVRLLGQARGKAQPVHESGGVSVPGHL